MEVKVSIIVPTFNRASYLGTTLVSVMAQTISEWECIVVDDGSEDGTEDLLNLIIKKDSRFIYLKRSKNRTKGGNTCRNIGLEYARGEFIQFLDSDDIISSSKLEDQLKALSGCDPDAIATCKWGFFNSNEDILSADPYKPTYINAHNPLELINIYSKHITYLPVHVFLVRKDLLKKVGPWNEDLIKNQDTEFFIRVLLHCTKVLFVPTAEAYYRIGAGNNVSVLASIGKIRSAILCWNLVNDAFFKKYNVNNHSLVKVGKTELYRRIKADFPEIVEANHEFFKGRYSRLNYFFIKVVSRTELMYFKKILPLFLEYKYVKIFNILITYPSKLTQRKSKDVR